MEKDQNFETGCCPRFEREKWDAKEIHFTDKLFLKDHVNSVFHIPLNYGKVMERDMAKIEKAGASIPDNLVLTDENSLWGADVYVAVDKRVPSADMVKMSGDFLTRVFEGPYSEMKKYTAAMEAFAENQGKKVKKILHYYAYCPKCAKDYGKNYIVLLAWV